jgi:hypothetical protein
VKEMQRKEHSRQQFQLLIAGHAEDQQGGPGKREQREEEQGGQSTQGLAGESKNFRFSSK